MCKHNEAPSTQATQAWPTDYHSANLVDPPILAEGTPRRWHGDAQLPDWTRRLYARVAPGAVILEKLAARRQTAADLASVLLIDEARLMRYFDGRLPVADIAPALSQFFGTSQALWRNLGRAWEEGQ